MTSKLPPLNVKKVLTLDKIEPTHLKEVFENWLADANTNLFLLVGESGSGKTHSLKQFISEEKINNIKILDFDELVEVNKGSSNVDIIPIEKETSILVFDNFDSVNTHTGHQTPPPDLRIIKSHIEKEKRVILISRRKPTELGDELINQLKNCRRTAGFKIKNPVTYLVVPWKLSEIRNFATSSENEYLLHVCKFLKKLPKNQRKYFLRPLTISTLMDKGNKLNIENTHSNLLDIYKEYCAIAISSDFDNRRSLISATLKERILRDLAKDIFTGNNGPEDRMLISRQRVEQRVLTHIMEAGLFDNNSKYNWTNDFISTVIVFQKSSEEQKGASSKELPISCDFCEFIDSSFYEYYLADAIVDDILHQRPLGLTIDRLSSNVIDIVALVFVKEWIDDSTLRGCLRKIFKTRPHLSIADKIIYLYLLEDDPQFLNILKSMPAEYFVEIKALELSSDNLFISNIIRFQLVVLGKYTANRYINELKKISSKISLQEEIKIHQSKEGLAETLVLRLQNRNLTKAAEIFIYRLGQLGYKPAIPILKAISAQTKSKKIEKLIIEVIEEINHMKL